MLICYMSYTSYVVERDFCGIGLVIKFYAIRKKLSLIKIELKTCIGFQKPWISCISGDLYLNLRIINPVNSLVVAISLKPKTKSIKKLVYDLDSELMNDNCFIQYFSQSGDHIEPIIKGFPVPQPVYYSLTLTHHTPLNRFCNNLISQHNVKFVYRAFFVVRDCVVL